MSQNDLAKVTGIPQSTLSAGENGRVNLGVERAKVIARAPVSSGGAGVSGVGTGQGHGRVRAARHAQDYAREEPTPAHSCSPQHRVSFEDRGW